MKILVLNAGSSSLKYSLFDMHKSDVLASGVIERIGENISEHRYTLAGFPEQHCELRIDNHQKALTELFAFLSASTILIDKKDLFCIGHRVVHGGEHFRQPVLIDERVIQLIAETIPLAPLHNPANLLGVKESMRVMPDIRQVAVFDTAFHQSLPDYAYRYPLPARLYEDHGVRRYGFHGASHCYVAKQAARFLGKPLENTNLITLHLGNGASACAIENGKSVDTSMGMTPLEGLMMGTRCGDIDPAIQFFLNKTLNMPSQTIEKLLNYESGCKGVCGENDMRTIHKLADSENETARLALRMYVHRIKKYIGAYFAVLNRVDALVFTGGIGENDAWLRENCCHNLTAFGIEIDSDKNRNPIRPLAEINTTSAKVTVLVIATHEELEIAMQSRECLENLSF